MEVEGEGASGAALASTAGAGVGVTPLAAPTRTLAPQVSRERSPRSVAGAGNRRSPAQPVSNVFAFGDVATYVDFELVSVLMWLRYSLKGTSHDGFCESALVTDYAKVATAWKQLEWDLAVYGDYY